MNDIAPCVCVSEKLRRRRSSRESGRVPGVDEDGAAQRARAARELAQQHRGQLIVRVARNQVLEAVLYAQKGLRATRYETRERERRVRPFAKRERRRFFFFFFFFKGI